MKNEDNRLQTRGEMREKTAWIKSTLLEVCRNLLKSIKDGQNVCHFLFHALIGKFVY